MKALLAFIGGTLAVTGGLVFLIILHVVFGALGALVVGVFFGDSILNTLARFGVDTDGLSMWKLGATLAFVGAFFKAHATATKQV